MPVGGHRQDQMYVDGGLERAYSNEFIPVVNPASEEHFADVVDGDGSDVDRAVSSARRCLDDSDWSILSPPERAALLRSLADAIERRADVLGPLVTSQNGMPIALSEHASARAPANAYRYFGSLAETLEIELEQAHASGTAIIRREPVGVAALIVPWNGPQALLAWKLGPALAAGCTVVVKPAPETSLDALVLADAIQDAGVPPGVVNIVTGGPMTGDALVRHRGVDKVAFTGSSATGRVIAAACGEALRPVTLELGGKSAAILLEDADLVAFGSIVSATCSPNTGQTCRALTRVLAPRSRYDEVVDLVVDAMQATPLGDPMDPGTVFGPLVSARQRDRVEGYIRIGQEEGAKLVLGGGRPGQHEVGYYVEPTVFRDVDNSMRIAREEVFGPVLVVIPYNDDDDAVRIANDSPFGLAGGVFSSDQDRALAIARRVQAGSIGVGGFGFLPLEVPFGGYKASGLGRELGPNSLDPYLETKALLL
jgi:aldehyde dehydrogenase (NAD+)